MTTFLFWNLNRKPLASIVANLARRHEVDVLMLTECEIPTRVMLRQLNRGKTEFHFSFDSLCEKIAIYTRFPSQFLAPEFEKDRMTIRRFSLPTRTEILLAVVHFASKLHSSDASQSIESTQLAQDIRDVEREIGHSRTVLVGDLNMNPFEDGVVAAAGFNAVMTRNIALRGTRTVQAREYPFFYNPMWGYFGDMTGEPPGTYYYQGSEQVTFFWNMFDQVLVRPTLIPYFSTESLKILSTDGTTSLLSDTGIPDPSVASDHLPILFRLAL
jgi:hypothetical protein